MLQNIEPFESGLPVLDVTEVIELEHSAAETGTSLLTLMNRAGNAVAQVACEMLEGRDSRGFEKKRAVILAGSGNNGGDGWVAASELANNDYIVALVSKTTADELKAEPARTAAMETEHKGEFQVLLSPTLSELGLLLNDADLIIDAILGTGFTHSEVRAPYDSWIEQANTAREIHGVSILAVDCPSGLNAQTGESATSCIDADVTITMIAAKTGLVQKDASEHIGKLLVAPIGVRVI